MQEILSESVNIVGIFFKWLWTKLLIDLSKSDFYLVEFFSALLAHKRQQNIFRCSTYSHQLNLLMIS